MIKAEIIMSKLNQSMHGMTFQVKKHSPEILVISGVVGVVASAVLACKATTKVGTVLEKRKKDLEQVDACLVDTTLTEEYTQEDAKKDRTIIVIQSGLEVVKTYAPAILLGTLSITCILAGNNILRKRNVALAAAYATLDKGFKEYRSRVVERFGTEVDKELKYNIKAKEFTKTVVNEDGTETTTTETVKVANITGYSEYARFFDESSSYWEKDSSYNLMFLKTHERYANDLLIAHGHLFLNEVYDMLDIPRTKAGQSVGWLYDPTKNVSGDNYVDFGIFETNREKARDFVNGYERAILLDFNVDGNILNKINVEKI